MYIYTKTVRTSSTTSTFNSVIPAQPRLHAQDQPLDSRLEAAGLPSSNNHNHLLIMPINTLSVLFNTLHSNDIFLNINLIKANALSSSKLD